MNRRFFHLNLMISVMIFVFSGCDSGGGDIYESGGNDLSIVDYDNEMTEYMERPDSGYIPGGGGVNKDKDQISDENYVPDEDTAPDENTAPDETNVGVYLTEPDVAKCEAGEVSAGEKTKVLNRLNYIRSLHNLPPVVYEKDDDPLTAECSLVIAANKQLSHTPESSWKCYSQDAYAGCSKSNIFIQMGSAPKSVESESIVDAFMTDENVDSLGHRRWFIDPWLAHISFGRVDDTANKVTGSAVKVINTDEQSISSSKIEFVAYPYEYYPAELYNDNVMMSFSVISDRTNKWVNNKVSFVAPSAIAIKDPNNKVSKITGMQFDNEGYGVPNNIRWFAEGIKPGVKYNVVITNVKINNAFESYSYWFELK